MCVYLCLGVSGVYLRENEIFLMKERKRKRKREHFQFSLFVEKDYI